MKRVSFGVVVALLTATGCGGGSGGGGGQTSGGSAIVAAPATLSFAALGPVYTQVVTVSEPDYGGTFHVAGSACSNVVMATAVAQHEFSVQPLAVGTCALQVADSAGRTGSISVTVTQTTIGGH